MQKTFRVSSGIIYMRKNIFVFNLGLINLIQYNSVLACVTQQKSCERLIHAAAELKKDDGLLYVIHVTEQNWNFFDNTEDGEAMEHLFSISKSYGADLTILNSNRIIETISQFAQHYKIELIVIGEAPEGNPCAFAEKLQELLDDSRIAVQVVASEQIKTF